jgi:signal transduction histidine kinase
MRLTLHFAGYFIIACLLILAVNYVFVISYVYRENQLYNYVPSDIFEQIDQGLMVSEGSDALTFSIDKTLQQHLEERQITIQVIDAQLKELSRFNDGGHLEWVTQYTPETLAEAYADDRVTMHLKSQSHQEYPYSILVYDFSGTVKRRAYTFQVDALKAAYQPLWLIGLNLSMLVGISFVYTRGMSRPIASILNQIDDLSEGRYNAVSSESGLYRDVSMRINELSTKLSEAEKQRQIIEEQSVLMAKQQQVLESERLKAVAIREAWITNLSHDLKTPLTAIVGYAELMEDDVEALDGEEQKRYVKSILAKCDYIRDLIGDLNLSARLQGDQVVLKRSRIDMVRLVRDILIDHLNQIDNAWEPNGLGSNESLKFHSDVSALWMSVDVGLFKRALINLIQNASIHNHPGVTIEIGMAVKDADSKMLLTLEDDGSGVAPEDIPHLFTRYYRGTNTEKQPEGSGLGMAIAADIIRAHGGDIKASNKQNGGLCIDIELPLISSMEEHT